MCLFAFLKPKFEFEGIFGNVLGHLLRINRENLKFLIFVCILGGLRFFYTIGKLYTQTRYGKPCVFLLNFKAMNIHVPLSACVQGSPKWLACTLGSPNVDFFLVVQLFRHLLLYEKLGENQFFTLTFMKNTSKKRNYS